MYPRSLCLGRPAARWWLRSFCVLRRREHPRQMATRYLAASGRGGTRLFHFLPHFGQQCVTGLLLEFLLPHYDPRWHDCPKEGSSLSDGSGIFSGLSKNRYVPFRTVSLFCWFSPAVQ